MKEIEINHNVKFLWIQGTLLLIVTLIFITLNSSLSPSAIMSLREYVIYIIIYSFSMLLMVIGILINAYPFIKRILAQKDNKIQISISKKRANISWIMLLFGCCSFFAYLIYIGISLFVTLFSTL